MSDWFESFDTSVYDNSDGNVIAEFPEIEINLIVFHWGYRAHEYTAPAPHIPVDFETLAQAEMFFVAVLEQDGHDPGLWRTRIVRWLRTVQTGSDWYRNKLMEINERNWKRLYLGEWEK